MNNPTVHELTISEDDAKDAIIHINIYRKGRGLEDNIFTVRFLEEDQGSLYLEVSEDSNPDESIANNYPEFFTMYQDSQHLEDARRRGDGEIITIVESRWKDGDFPETQEDQHTHGLTTTVDGEII